MYVFLRLVFPQPSTSLAPTASSSSLWCTWSTNHFFGNHWNVEALGAPEVMPLELNSACNTEDGSLAPSLWIQLDLSRLLSLLPQQLVIWVQSQSA
jgi:hypothetical protein